MIGPTNTDTNEDLSEDTGADERSSELAGEEVSGTQEEVVAKIAATPPLIREKQKSAPDLIAAAEGILARREAQRRDSSDDEQGETEDEISYNPIVVAIMTCLSDNKYGLDQAALTRILDSHSSIGKKYLHMLYESVSEIDEKIRYKLKIIACLNEKLSGLNAFLSKVPAEGKETREQREELGNFHKALFSQLQIMKGFLLELSKKTACLPYAYSLPEFLQDKATVIAAFSNFYTEYEYHDILRSVSIEINKQTQNLGALLAGLFQLAPHMDMPINQIIEETDKLFQKLSDSVKPAPLESDALITDAERRVQALDAMSLILFMDGPLREELTRVKKINKGVSDALLLSNTHTHSVDFYFSQISPEKLSEGVNSVVEYIFKYVQQHERRLVALIKMAEDYLSDPNTDALKLSDLALVLETVKLDKRCAAYADQKDQVAQTLQKTIDKIAQSINRLKEELHDDVKRHYETESQKTQDGGQNQEVSAYAPSEKIRANRQSIDQIRAQLSFALSQDDKQSKSVLLQCVALSEGIIQGVAQEYYEAAQPSIPPIVRLTGPFVSLLMDVRHANSNYSSDVKKFLGNSLDQADKTQLEDAKKQLQEKLARLLKDGWRETLDENMRNILAFWVLLRGLDRIDKIANKQRPFGSLWTQAHKFTQHAQARLPAISQESDEDILLGLINSTAEGNAIPVDEHLAETVGERKDKINRSSICVVLASYIINAVVLTHIHFLLGQITESKGSFPLLDYSRDSLQKLRDSSCINKLLDFIRSDYGERDEDSRKKAQDIVEKHYHHDRKLDALPSEVQGFANNVICFLRGTNMYLARELSLPAVSGDLPGHVIIKSQIVALFSKMKCYMNIYIDGNALPEPFCLPSDFKENLSQKLFLAMAAISQELQTHNASLSWGSEAEKRKLLTEGADLLTVLGRSSLEGRVVEVLNNDITAMIRESARKKEETPSLPRSATATLMGNQDSGDNQALGATVASLFGGVCRGAKEQGNNDTITQNCLP